MRGRPTQSSDAPQEIAPPMVVLVTRPEPDNATTAATLRAQGFEVLSAPMLRFDPVAMPVDADARYGAVIVTSANALRATGDQPAIGALHDLPLYAVGDRTAEAARAAGFRNVIAAGGDAGALRELVADDGNIKRGAVLLYLAGADLSRDIAGELGARGFTVVTQTTYRMTPVTALPAEVRAAFAAGDIDMVLHYSRRSARAFFAAARAAGVEISALALPHACLSDQVAAIARDAGATHVRVARTPDETALLAVLGHAIRPAGP